MRRMIVAATALALWLPPALAQSPAETELRGTIAAAVDFIEGAGLTVEISRPIEYVAREGGVDAIVPDLQLRVTAGEYVEIGTLTVSLRPAGGGASDYRMALPERIGGTPGSGNPGSMTARGGSVSVRWHAADRRLEGFDLSVDGFAFNAPGETPDRIDLGRLVLRFAMRADVAGNQALDYEFGVADAAVPGQPSPLFAARRLRVAGTLGGFPMERFDRFVDALVASFSLGERDQDEAITRALLEFAPPVMRNTVEMEALEANDGGPVPLFALGRMEYVDAFETDSRGIASYTARLRHDRLALREGLFSFQRLLPTAASFDLAATGLPGREYQAFTMLAQDVRGWMRDPGAVIAAWRVAYAAAARTGARFSVTGLRYDAPDFGLELAGDASARDDAPLGAVGAFELTVRDLDELATVISGWYPAVLDFLAPVQAAGRAAADASGRAALAYRMELTAQGAIAVNGIDLRPLFAGRNPPSKAPAPSGKQLRPHPPP